MGNGSRHKVDYAFADTLTGHGGQVTGELFCIPTANSSYRMYKLFNLSLFLERASIKEVDLSLGSA
jgi:hypothetical protein